MINRALPWAGLVCAAVSGMAACAPAAEFFVNKQGHNAHPGTSRDAAWASIQKGVDALAPGDTLTIGPGEYFQSVRRADLGSPDRETVIRAEIPGTVLLRGDVPVPALRPLAGRQFVYEADFAAQGDVPAVNEIDTLTILKRMPNSSELEFVPGTFYHDARAGKLFIATSDMKPAAAHRYSVSVIPTHGLLLIRPRRVAVEGIAATGFSAMTVLSYREETAGGVWGLFLVNGKDCAIRDCQAYLNAWGIGISSAAAGAGDNIIQRCAAWGNRSTYTNGDMGGISAYNAQRDTIRDCTAWLNGVYGINIYGTGGAPPGGNDGGNDPQNKSRLVGNLAWGNAAADFKIKTGYEYHHTAEKCTAPGLWSVANIEHGLVGRAAGPRKETQRHCVFLGDHPGLDLRREFADPEHHDYRLQATSRFRAQGNEGADLGPFPYVPNVFYVGPAGDDEADGLSTARAWRTLTRATRGLRPGDTVYLEPGTYDADFELRVQGERSRPVTLRGRGPGQTILRGPLRLGASRSVAFERLCFRGGLEVTRSSRIAICNCRSLAASVALQAEGVDRLEVSHCILCSSQQSAAQLSNCTQVDLSGNFFSSAAKPALKLDRPGMVRYSNYNGYRGGLAAWEVAGKRLALGEVQSKHDQQSRELDISFPMDDEIADARIDEAFAAGGPLGRPIGPYEDQPRRVALCLVEGPAVHSASATTANLEWTTSLPATCHLAWGETPACERSESFDTNGFGTYSLTGLKPGRRYYFRIKAIEIPRDMLPKDAPAEDWLKPVELSREPISFQTQECRAAPATYYVAADGDDARSGRDRQNAWQTIRRAAAAVNAGDTVLVAGGKYCERIRLRATGDVDAPITFRCLPGERVELDGDQMLLPGAFVAAGKSHLRFDGFYFSRFNLFPNEGWKLALSGEFQLYRGRDIRITRCFSEGRGGYSAPPVTALEVKGLSVKNCVSTYKFNGMYFWRCPDLRVENSVFAAPMITAYVLRNAKEQSAVMENCVFTDMLENCTFRELIHVSLPTPSGVGRVGGVFVTTGLRRQASIIPFP